MLYLIRPYKEKTMTTQALNKPANSEYLDGIIQNDFSTLQRIYQESLPEVIKYVKKNSGTLEDAKDVFQEGILVVFNKVKANELELTTRFPVFLFMVCKRIWLRKLRKPYKETGLEKGMDIEIEENLEEKFIKSQKWKLFNTKFQLLAKECQTVLRLFFNGSSSKEIAEAMGYSEEYAKRKKYKCKSSLAASIQQDPVFNTLKD